MAEFKSSLFRHLAAAAEIPYNPNLPADEVVYRRVDENGKVIKFINDDQRRMEAMKTAIIKVILLRACNDMIQKNQDKIRDPKERVANSEFNILFTDENVEHKDGAPSAAKFFDLESLISKANSSSGTVSTQGGPKGNVAPCHLDAIGQTPDLEILTLRMNFVGDVEAIVRKPMLVFNCP